MENQSLNELLIYTNEIQWILRIKYKIDYKELYNTIIERLQDDIVHEPEVSFDGKRNYKQEKENVIKFLRKLI